MENDPHEGKRVLYDAFKAYNEIPKALGVPIPLHTVSPWRLHVAVCRLPDRVGGRYSNLGR